MKKLIVALLLITAYAAVGYSQKIHWRTWDEVQQLQKKEARKVFVDVETSWCAICKNHDEITFKNPELVKYINENYYPIKFDAESRKNIHIGKKTYRFKHAGKRGYHELAYAITRGKLMYPTLVFLEPNFGVIQAIEGYQGPERLQKVATYFALDYHKSKPWKEFSEEYNSYQAPRQPVHSSFSPE